MSITVNIKTDEIFADSLEQCVSEFIRACQNAKVSGDTVVVSYDQSNSDIAEREVMARIVSDYLRYFQKAYGIDVKIV